MSAAVAGGLHAAQAGTTGGISGVATAPDGSRVAGLPLTIINPVTGVLTATTDKQGFFVLLALPPGRYMFMGTHLGGDYFFRADCIGVDVHADQVSQVHIWLDRKWVDSSCGDLES
ncbi:MAG: carboxypeptidase regulatory-like domain-containing protein [Candidatus Eremiobacteraeota bacterium]|nr:carboxypeptidase regulatory-like domain-containing protein [Candidatus Eremiobacteraeota bacterium]MBV9646979.1 carboxypeptidase regulatory-like domain-containing protein [Candidatus Eremiobacteraeota bacterium]